MTGQIGGTHYEDVGIDPLTIIRAWRGTKAVEHVLLCKILKYLCRYEKKNGVEDIRKAEHCMDMLLTEVLLSTRAAELDAMFAKEARIAAEGFRAEEEAFQALEARLAAKEE